jgi:hypothetical protein
MRRLSPPELERRLLQLQPEAMRSLNVMRRTACEATDPAMLELCRIRLAQLLRDDAARGPHCGAPIDEQLMAALGDWRESERFTASQRAHLAFAEQFSVSVASLTDEDVAALREHLSELQVYEFAVALYVIEMEMRMRRVVALTLTSPAVHDD